MEASVLAIGGSDPAGLSGLEADLKTLSCFGVKGLRLETARTHQSAIAFEGAVAANPSRFAADLDALLASQSPGVIKVGMLANADIVLALAEALEAVDRLTRPRLVLDPVLESTSGGILLDADGRRALVERLLPLAELVTPNSEEAARLVQAELPRSMAELIRLGEALLEKGARAVSLKGGHLDSSQVEDCLLEPGLQRRLGGGPRREGGPFRGTGCTLASAMAACLARDFNMETSAELAHGFTAAAIANATQTETHAILDYGAAAQVTNII